jgi:hypothetical protein
MSAYNHTEDFMNKKLFISLLFIAFIAISAKAQSNLPGSYYYDKKIDEGRNTLRLVFELKGKNAAVYVNKQDENETQRRFGTWTYNKKLSQITVIMPPVKKNPMQGQEVKLTFVFKVVGNKLKLVKDLPYREGKGEIYQKL